METGVFWDLGSVSDVQIRSGLATLLASGYRTEARIIAHVAEVEAERLAARRRRDARATDAEVVAANVRREVSAGTMALPGPE
jgi:hypothetical protein